MLHIPPTNLLLLAVKQESYKKAYLLTKNIEEFSGKKIQKKGPVGRKDKIERVTGLGRRTREEIVKWNHMTAVRFQMGRGEGGDIRHLRPSFGGCWTVSTVSKRGFKKSRSVEKKAPCP